MITGNGTGEEIRKTVFCYMFKVERIRQLKKEKKALEKSDGIFSFDDLSALFTS